MNSNFLNVLVVDDDNECVFGKKGRRKKKGKKRSQNSQSARNKSCQPNQPNLCPICFESIDSYQQRVSCCVCGNGIHSTCFRLYRLHDTFEELRCPFCRKVNSFKRKKNKKNLTMFPKLERSNCSCSNCYNACSSNHYICKVCPRYYLCSKCYKLGSVHLHHTFRHSLSTRSRKSLQKKTGKNVIYLPNRAVSYPSSSSFNQQQKKQANLRRRRSRRKKKGMNDIFEIIETTDKLVSYARQNMNSWEQIMSNKPSSRRMSRERKKDRKSMSRYRSRIAKWKGFNNTLTDDFTSDPLTSNSNSSVFLPNINNSRQILQRPTTNFDLSPPSNLTPFLRDLQTRDISPNDYGKLVELDNNIHRKTLKLKDLKKIKKVDFSAREIKVKESGCNLISRESDSKCPICLEPATNKVSVLRCGHFFHPKCITKWLTVYSTKCPVCKQNVSVM